MKQLSTHEIKKVRSAKIQAAVYAAIGLGACWLVVFAVTGSILRALMFIVGLLLIIISITQFNAITHRIRLITMSPYMQKFEEWVSKTAAEDLKAGDAVYLDQEDKPRKIK